MDYAATYSYVFIRYHASNIILLVDSDVSYLVMPKAKSRVAGYFQLNDDPKCITHPIVNRVILVEYKALYYVVSSTTKAKTSGIFYNAQVAIPI